MGEKESAEEEGGAIEEVEEKKNSKENVLEKPTSAAAAPVPATSSPKMKDSGSPPDLTVGEEGNTSGWPTLPDSFYQNLDSPFLGKDDLIEESLQPESPDYDRQRLQDASKTTQAPLPSNLHKPIIKSLDPIASNILGRAGEEGLEDLRRRRRLLLARLQMLKKEKKKAKEKGSLRGRDGEEEEMAILSLEAKEGGASLHKRIMDYTSRDFSARTDPTTAIVNAASRHLD